MPTRAAAGVGSRSSQVTCAGSGPMVVMMARTTFQGEVDWRIQCTTRYPTFNTQRATQSHGPRTPSRITHMCSRYRTATEPSPRCGLRRACPRSRRGPSHRTKRPGRPLRTACHPPVVPARGFSRSSGLETTDIKIQPRGSREADRKPWPTNQDSEFSRRRRREPWRPRSSIARAGHHVIAVTDGKAASENSKQRSSARPDPPTRCAFRARRYVGPVYGADDTTKP